MSGICSRSSLNEELKREGASARRRICRCSSSADCPFFAARSLNSFTSSSSMFRTISCAISSPQRDSNDSAIFIPTIRRSRGRGDGHRGAGAASDADKLRQMIEVTVARVQNEIVLENQRCHPHVIRRDRRSLFSKLPKQRGVMVSGLIVGKENFHAILHQEASQYSLVVGLLSSVRKTGPELSENDERQDDGLGFFQENQSLGIAPTKIDIAIRVERDSHFQRSSSTRSCAATASSKALSAFHVPAMSERFRRLRGAPTRPAPSASASMAASFRLLREARAR
jgi:hypothetical protein